MVFIIFGKPQSYVRLAYINIKNTQGNQKQQPEWLYVAIMFMYACYSVFIVQIRNTLGVKKSARPIRSSSLSG